MPRRRSRAGSKELQTAAKPRQMMDDLFSAAYRELRRLAACVKRADVHATISTSTLVHEAWMKLAGSPGLTPQSELHFKRTAACAMRQIVMDEARRHRAYKRGGRGVALFVTLDDSVDVPVSSHQDWLRLDAALDALAQVNPRQAELVQLRFFGGHDVAEASALLSIAESTALRDWRVAKAWLAAEIRRGR
jgi:RNA polymerase sigma factor (TIGR02999 family)